MISMATENLLVEHSLRECGLGVGGTGVWPVLNRRDAGSTGRRFHRDHAKTTGEDDEKAERHQIEEENQIVLQSIDARQREGVVGDA